MYGCLNIGFNCSSVDEVTKEKLVPFSTLSGDESYQSRDLEKVRQSSKYILGTKNSNYVLILLVTDFFLFLTLRVEGKVSLHMYSIL